MALSVSCTCCTLVSASAGCCGYLCYPSAVKRLWPLWSNPVPLSLIRCTCIVPLFLRCCVICHMVLIALKREKVLRLPLRSYRLYNRISQFQFDRGQDKWSGSRHGGSEGSAARWAQQFHGRDRGILRRPLARGGPGSRGSIQLGIRGLKEAEEITHTDLWTKSQAGESGQVKVTMTVPQSYAIEQKWVESIVHLRKKLECVNEWNVSHLQILLIETLYYELYYYGYWWTL